MKPQLLIGAATPGSGKTVFALGLMRALQQRGLQVQPFKCGPDYIDTQFHTLATGHESVNLDTWMATDSHVQYLYNKYGEGSDVCLVEGSLGLFDGFHRMRGSSAEIARLLNIPVILVVNARSTAYSVAPLIYGFQQFNSSLKVAGVLFNQVSSPSHYACLRDACADAGVKCLGYLPVDEGLKLPSRHVGMTLTVKQTLEEVIARAAQRVTQTVDLNRLLSICQRTFPCAYSLPFSSEVGVESFAPASRKLRIAVAKDPAFHFTYRENLDRLAEWGRISFFSPVYSSELPEADWIYLPGGCPELFARQLHRRKKLMEDLKAYAEAGGKVLAEGGGMLLLTRSLTVRQGGTAYPMAGVLPIDCTMVGARMQVGYRRIEYAGLDLRGHELHYSQVLNPQALPSAGRQFTTKGLPVATPFYRYKNVIASYTHLYWGETDLRLMWKR